MAKPPKIAESAPTDTAGSARYRFGPAAFALGALVRRSGLPAGLSAGAISAISAIIEERAGAAAAAGVTPGLANVASEAIGMLPTQVSNAAALDPEDLQPMAIGTSIAMDPRLQLAIANRRSGKKGLFTASTASDEVAVIARVKTRAAWTEHPDVVPGSSLGKSEKGGWIVTGRIPLDRAEAVRSSPGVLSLKAAQAVQPALKATIEAMGTAPAALPTGFDPSDGAGAVIGIVDFGCDFEHMNFRAVDGSTRVEAIWDQGGIAGADSPFGYGRLYRSDKINAALAAADPYSSLGYGPEPDTPSQAGSHGTHVMDIAAGNGRGSSQAGVAPAASIIFVEASSSDISWVGPGTVNQAFGDSVQLLEAVRFIFDEAGTRPCVVNLSLGTNGGPHDGTSLVEQGLDALVREAPNRAVVIAASNSQEDNIHTSGQVPGSASADIVWTHSPFGGGEFELWYPGGQQLSVELIAPDGTNFGLVGPNQNLPLGSSEVVIFISNRLQDPNNGDNVIGIWVADSVAGGDWTVRLTALGPAAVDYHAWIERNDRAQSSFAAPVPTHTLGSISTGQETIVVGSFDAHKTTMPLSGFSSSGPTRDGRDKPEISAPGHAVIAARSRTTSGVIRKSGTSMAAPAVTGLVALIYADALRTGASLTIEDLRKRLLANVKRDPPPGKKWDARYGFGRAHV
ncbi:S8 family peptidase [Sphingomonas sp. VNH70]|uniref:S8 family peptidase n=1 Tax=Sphingomonas silueang TaxID=3156617 RepID=UPI0032B5611E